MDVIFILLCVVSVMVLGVSFLLVQFTFRPKVMAYEEAIQIEVDHGSFTQDYLDTFDMGETFIDSPHGYDIHVACIMVNNPIGTVIMAHGYTATLYSMMKYDHMFRDMGFNVVMYDQRYHGLSGGDCCTFGAKEKDDLSAVLDYTISKVGSENPIGTFGESLGGATVLKHGAEDTRIAFIISDCAYADAGVEFAERVRADYHLPAYIFIKVSSFLSKLLLGHFYKDMSPIEVANKIKAPTLIIHGKDDRFTHVHHGYEIFEALTCNKSGYFVEGADHAASYFVNQDRYRDVVETFLVKQGLKI